MRVVPVRIEKLIYTFRPADLGPELDAYRRVLQILDNQTPTRHFRDGLPVSADWLDAVGLAEIEEYIRAHRERAAIDYCALLNFLCFDQAYFFRNFFKCLVGVRCLAAAINLSGSERHIIDIGCGAGTFALAAYLLWNRWDEYILVDKELAQLCYAKKLFEAVEVKNVKFLHADGLSLISRRGFRIASYWLCGNKNALINATDEMLHGLLRDGCGIIDYAENVDAFMSRVQAIVGPNRIRRIEANTFPPDEIAKAIRSARVNVHLLAIDPIQD